MEFTAKQIAEYIQGEVVGDENAAVSNFSKIEEGVPGTISFLSNPKYAHFLYTTSSSIVLVNSDFVIEQEVKPTLIKVKNAYESVARLLTLYEMYKPRKTGVSELAYIAESATIGENCYIAPFASIEEHAVVGDNTDIHSHVAIGVGAKVGSECKLFPHVTVYHECEIGDRCILHAGCVIGADGFGFAPAEDGYEKIPQIGNVVIEDDVEIGANSCIDRSTMGSTFVRRGAKLDNLVQIAHNVEVGSHTVMSAQVGVAGSTKIGSWCMFGGQVGIAGHATIADRTKSGAQAGIAGTIRQSDTTVQGTPAIDAKSFARASVVYKKLPEIYTEFNALKKELEELKKQLNK